MARRASEITAALRRRWLGLRGGRNWLSRCLGEDVLGLHQALDLLLALLPARIEVRLHPCTVVTNRLAHFLGLTLFRVLHVEERLQIGDFAFDVDERLFRRP